MTDLIAFLKIELLAWKFTVNFLCEYLTGVRDFDDVVMPNVRV